MAWVTVGNPNIGEYKTKVYEPEDEEFVEIFLEEFGTTEVVETAFEEKIYLGYMIKLPNATNGKKIKLGFYGQCGDAYFLEWLYGLDGVRYSPVAFIMDSNGNIKEILNKTFNSFWEGDKIPRWFTCELELTRNAEKGEYLFGGFYFDHFCPVWDDFATEEELRAYGITGTPAISYSFTKNGDDIDELALLKNNESSKFKKFEIKNIEQYSVYFQYDFIPPSVAYTRNLTASLDYSSKLSKKISIKKDLIQSIVYSSSLTRKQNTFRNITKTSSLKTLLKRTVKKTVKSFELFPVKSFSQKKILLSRNSKDECKTHSVFLKNIFYRISLDGIVAESDTTRRFISFFILINHSLYPTALQKRKADLKKTEESETLISDNTARSSELVRNTISDVNIAFNIFAGRLIFRIIETAFSLWDWIKGKIREENCVIELFCPITDELILECRL